ncbi:MAG TPA: exodeoxyribonuclease VII small subunit [bacterium]
MKKTDTDINFEEALKKLDKIVEKLEMGNIPLEDALKQFDAGVRLVRYLNERLEDAERKIELLVKDKEGKITKKEIDVIDGEIKDVNSKDKNGRLF